MRLDVIKSVCRSAVSHLGPRLAPAWSPPMPSPNWKDLYDQAVLETHPEKIAQRVQTACEAIHHYRTEKGFSLSSEEREEIDGALRALFVLVERRGTRSK